MKKNKHFGSSFDECLIEKGIHEEATAHAVKRVLAWQVSEGEGDQQERNGEADEDKPQPARPEA